jgi:hypothetical protein
MGIIDLGMTAESGQAEDIIQLSTNLPLNPVMRVFDAGSGSWSTLSTGALDDIASAPSTGAGCPVSTSDNYRSGLAVGLSCVRLRIQDGGPADTDGLVDGKVQVMVNIAQAAGLDDGPAPVDLSPGKSGGGILTPWMLLLLMLNVLLRKQGAWLRARG